MKPSHLKTPRTIDDCHFTPGYKSWEEAGHNALPWICAVGMLVVLAMELAGWLPGGAA